MKRYRIEKLPMALLDRLADYAKMDWWLVETYKKTVSSGQLADLSCAFLVENLERFTGEERLEIYRCFVLTGVIGDYETKELLKSFGK